MWKGRKSKKIYAKFIKKKIMFAPQCRSSIWFPEIHLLSNLSNMMKNITTFSPPPTHHPHHHHHHRPMHWPMQGPACPSTPTPIRPHLTCTHQVQLFAQKMLKKHITSYLIINIILQKYTSHITHFLFHLQSPTHKPSGC